MSASERSVTLPVNDKREIFGWAMYDWANSAFSTTVGTVFLGPYVASLAEQAAEAFPDGMARLLGVPIAPDSFFPYCVSISVTDPQNQALLWPGLWTYPAGTGSFVVALSDGSTASNINFGWDYQNLP